MFYRFILKAACLCLVLAAGCDKPRAASSTPPATAPQPAAYAGPAAAQPKLRTVKLFVGTNEITAEIARKPREIETGMMFRTELDEMAGMLFVFPRPDFRSFWMKNCPLPMTCAYIAPDGEILEIRDMIPHETKGILSRSSSVQFVLEMNRDWFKQHNLAPGAVITTEHGPLLETFYGR